jgi:hypothetical protein
VNLARPLEDGGRERVRAPLFALALEPFEDGKRHVVLDLGRARGGTVDLFGRYRCRLDIVDLPARIQRLPDLEDPGAVEAWFEGLLPPERGEQVDLILCWNLLNYLPPALIERLGERLAGRAAAGARLHALIEYSATQMPAAPLSFAPREGELEALPAAEEGLVQAPRHTPKELEKRLPGFRSERTMLLGNGMQEFLYRR